MDIVLVGSKHCWKFPLSRSELVDFISKICKGLSLKYLEIFLVRDATMATINKKYMDCYGITNILSFSMDIYNNSGSLVLSVDTVHRESLLYGQNISMYYCTLLLHGIGHILGYEHGVEMDSFCNSLLEQTTV